ncbi:MAG: glycosyltransferase [Candidatus Vogelbacteria bacterium]|nr:glycosyltransferase [Candidatus Vogelbacteria bacterium]
MIVCYFGIYRLEAIRDRLFLEGLKKLDVEVVECVSLSNGVWKFVELFTKLLALKNNYDILWVGYSSGVVVPVARLVSNKTIVYNALNSLYESVILDQERHSRISLTAIRIWLSDFLAFHLADIVLVETEEQKEFISSFFWVKSSKLKVVFTGADEKVFYPDSNIRKLEKFTVVFRGWLVNATGAEYILEAAKMLRDIGKNIDIIIIGRGQRQNDIKNVIEEDNLTNVKLIMNFLSPDRLRETILSCHVMLGQFGPHARMDRTIQYKTFEAMALGMPYITRESKSNRELLQDRVNCLFVKAGDARDLVDKILELETNQQLRQSLSRGARKLFESRLGYNVAGRIIHEIIVGAI